MNASKLTGSIGRERLHVKRFASCQAMHGFLNKQDGSWNEASYHVQGLSAGIYVSLAGKWTNIKTLDPSVLTHV